MREAQLGEIFFNIYNHQDIIEIVLLSFSVPCTSYRFWENTRQEIL